MSHWILVVIAILLFAVATAFVYGWGIIKQHEQSYDLYRLLYSKGVERVNKYLKKHDSITAKEMEALVENIQAKLFYSKNRAVVTDKKDFVEHLIAYMTEYHMLEKEKRDGKVVYRKPR